VVLGLGLAVLLGIGSVKLCRQDTGAGAAEISPGASIRDAGELHRFLNRSARSAARQKLEEIEAREMETLGALPAKSRK
jgi:hypothetical protein